MTRMRVLIDGHVVARHDGPIFDDEGKVTPGTAMWWFRCALRPSIRALAKDASYGGRWRLEFFDPPDAPVSWK